MYPKDAQIIAQVAGKLALEAINADDTVDLSVFPVYTKSIADAIAEVAEELTTAPEPAVVVGQNNGAPNNMAQAVSNLNQGGIQTSPAGGTLTDDQAWEYFVNNLDDFYDNRGDGDTTIKGGNRPDFRAKTLTDKDGRKRGMFLVSRRYNKRAPDFVFQAIGEPIPNLDQPAVPAPTTTAPAPAEAPF